MKIAALGENRAFKLIKGTMHQFIVTYISTLGWLGFWKNYGLRFDEKVIRDQIFPQNILAWPLAKSQQGKQKCMLG